MRTPNKRQVNYSKRMLKLASQDDEDHQKVFLTIKLMEEETAKNPFIDSASLRSATIKRAIEEGMDDMEADRMYRAASQVVVPFLKSGEKILRSDALLDGLVKKAEAHLMEDVYDKDGNVVGERFSHNVMNAITKALSVKLQTLTKIQSNLISAQKESHDVKDDKDFKISEADKAQLERFIGGELIENPEIVEMLISQSDNKDIIEIKHFHESAE